MNFEKIRAAVRERDGFRCTGCGSTKKGERNLHVHRLIPGSTYSEAGCVTLCPSCHKRVHVAMRPRRKGGKINVRLKPELKAALGAYLGTVRPERTVTAVIEMLLEDFLGAKGMWPVTGK